MTRIAIAYTTSHIIDFPINDKRLSKNDKKWIEIALGDENNRTDKEWDIYENNNWFNIINKITNDDVEDYDIIDIRR